jgi:serine/threonine-protein kinase PpkA
MQIEIPGYRIIKTLGKGGMASVYLAIQESFEREVALKVMSADLSSDPSFGERFIREAKIVSRLVHPNIVTVYDVGIHEGHYFLSMEYIPGQDLTHKRHELTLVENLQVVKDIARALDFAGRKGYVHRDVKPENIMFHEESGRPVLMDFGIARPSDVSSGMTQTGMAIGTPHYMSPEQAKGQAVDARADLYSLGVVLFLLLTGHVPFDADSAVVVGIMHVSEEIPRLPAHLQIFQPIINKVLAKNPADRYQTGTELIAHLDALKMQDISTAAEARLVALIDLAKKSEEKKAKNAMATTITPSEFDITGKFKNSAQNKTVLTPRTITPPAATASISNKNNKTQLDDRLVISAQDRLGHFHTEPEKKSNKPVGLLFVLMLSLGAAGYYYQTEIIEFSQQFIAGKKITSGSPVVATAPLSTANQDELKKKEELKKSEELQKAEELRKSEEIRKAEEARLAAELKAAEELKLAEETKKLEEAKIAEDIKRAEEIKRIEEAKIAEEIKKQEELKKLQAQERAQQEKAKAEKNRAEKNAVQQIQRLIQDKKLDDASSLLKSAQANFPQSEALLGLSVEISQAIADTLPAVTRLSVTSEEVSRLIYPQEPDIAADRVIYIGFEYRNFSSEASVIQATLYDGSRNHQIVQVPVVVNGAEGTKFFRMEQPVSGFAEGGYNIDLQLQNQLLISAKFTVKKSL